MSQTSPNSGAARPLSSGGIAIIGGGGHGREIADVVGAALGTDSLAGIADDGSIDLSLLDAARIPFLGTTADLVGQGFRYLVGIGAGEVRCAVVARLGHEDPADAVLHPSATCGSLVSLGPGTVVGPGATITTNVTIGRHVYIGPHAVVSHDCVLGDYVTVLPGALLSGGVVVGDGATIGMGAMVRQYLSVGAWAFVGAGALALHDVEARAVVVGVPARRIDSGR